MVSGLGTDILLVTATTIEARAVLEAFATSAQRITPQSLDGRVYFDLGTLNGAHVRMTQCEMGTGGLGASLQAVSKGIATLSPAAVIMVGIAFGISEETQAIGDVLVTERLRPYDLQRVGTSDAGDLRITLRDDKPHASPWLLNLLRSAELTWEGASLRFGTVLTGAKLVDNVDFRDQLRAFEPEAIGGKMEGAGLYVACHDRKVDWILVKSICDFADGQKAKNKAERQAIAAKHAATFAHHAIQFVKVDWDMHHRRAQSSVSVAKVPEASGDLQHPQRPRTPSLSDGASHHLVSSGHAKLLSAHDRILTRQLEQLDELAALFEGKSEIELRSDAGLEELIVNNWLRIVDDYAYMVFRMAPKDADNRPYRKTQRTIITTEALVKYYTPANERVRPDSTNPKPKSAHKDPRAVPWAEYDLYELKIPDQLGELQDTLTRFAESRFIPTECIPLIRAYNTALDANVKSIWQLLREAAREFPSTYSTFGLLTRATPSSVLFEFTSRVHHLKETANAIVSFVRKFITVDAVSRNR